MMFFEAESGIQEAPTSDGMGITDRKFGKQAQENKTW